MHITFSAQCLSTFLIVIIIYEKLTCLGIRDFLAKSWKFKLSDGILLINAFLLFYNRFYEHINKEESNRFAMVLRISSKYSRGCREVLCGFTATDIGESRNCGNFVSCANDLMK